MSGQWEPVPSAHLLTPFRPRRRRLSSDWRAPRNGTPAAQWTRSASRRWWVNRWRFGRAATTARCHWSSPFHRTGRGRKQRASCCGSGNELTSGVRSPTRSERPSISSGRKNISGHGKRPGERGAAMKIRAVTVNNRRKVFAVRTSKGELVYPFAKPDQRPTDDDPIALGWIDKELASEAFTYALRSGREGTVHIAHDRK